MHSATGVAEIRDLIEEVRRETAQRILDGLYPDGAPPKARTAVSGWLWFMDGACLDWIEHRDIERGELRDLLLGVLMGALIAADAPPDLASSLLSELPIQPFHAKAGTLFAMLVCALLLGALLAGDRPRPRCRRRS